MAQRVHSFLLYSRDCAGYNLFGKQKTFLEVLDILDSLIYNRDKNWEKGMKFGCLDLIPRGKK